MRLDARDIVAGYDGADVLHSVQIGLDQGEFVGLIGPNGCGKSTLLRVLSSLLKPRAGTVQIDAQTITHWSARDRALRLAFVPQQETAAFDFTVHEVVLMGRYPHRQRLRGHTVQDYEIATAALAEADLLHLADRPIPHLSGGEHRRVLLARALAQQTPLLLLDEPTAHLDITHQVELMALVRRLTRETGIGALAALHDLNQAAEFCDRLILMHAGRVLADGPPEEVLTVAHMRRAYEADAQIGKNPITGRPYLLALHPAREQAASPKAPRVHLLCGGGSGIALMGWLVRNGFHVTAGVLNRLDSDQEAAAALGIEVVLETPFSAISPAARDACAQRIADAEIVLLAEVPFGHGNLANLELARAAQAQGKRIVLIGNDRFAARDFTDGLATRLQQDLLAHGAQRYDRPEDWPQSFHEAS